jgi:predicted DsbA family dithiol-disulfide isomerase
MLIAHASQQGRGDALVEALFTAYFEEGSDIGDTDVLLGVAEKAGLDAEQAREALNDEELRGAVVARERKAGELGISGVPFFIVDRTWAVSGAQPAPAWLEALKQIKIRSAGAAAAK